MKFFRIVSILLALSCYLHLVRADDAASSTPAAATLTHAQAAAEIADLKTKIERANYAYYILDAPEISDADYDVLMRRLRELEKQFPDLVTSDSPTQRVGAPASGEFAVVTHRAPMLSLLDVRSRDELQDWDNRARRVLGVSKTRVLDYVCEPKLDGLSISLIYENGILTRGETRGDGFKGEDITANLKTVGSIPLKLNLALPPKLIEVRGELFMARTDFEKLNALQQKNGLPLFANPRNAAAGSVRQKNPKITASRALKFSAYAVGAVEDVNLETQEQLLKWLAQAGFRVDTHWKACRGLDEVFAFVNDWKTRRTQVDYPTDGAVVKLNSLAWQKQLGFVGRDVRWACAWKFAPDEIETQVLNIEWTVGRTGVLTPVVELSPVEISGSVVSKATLFNEANLKRLDVRVGDEVVVHKANEIVPEIVSVSKEKRDGTQREYSIPTTCPVCGAALVRESETNLRCDNPQCPAQLEAALSHFVARDAMNISGVGAKLIHELVEADLVHDVADLFALRKTDLMKLPRVGDAGATRVLASLEKAKTPNFANFLNALGIREIGARSAQILAQRFGSLGVLQAASETEIATCVGPRAAREMKLWLDDERHRKLLKKLREAGVMPQSFSQNATAEN